MPEIHLNHHGNCPECGVSWDAGNIFDVLRPQDWCKDMSDDELRAYVHQCYSPPYKFSRIVGIEYAYDHPQHYDGVSEWMCPDCKHRWPRFLYPSREEAWRQV
jgi:hypothetical protein